MPRASRVAALGAVHWSHPAVSEIVVIPTIGLMVGVIGITACFYMFTRVALVLAPPREGHASALASIGAVLTIVSAALSLLILLAGSYDLVAGAASGANPVR